MKSIAITITALLIVSVSFVTISCKKETDCKAVIKCVDASGYPVSGANVYLYAPVPVRTNTGTTTYTADVTASGTTDGSGVASFVFELPATFDIRATATIDTSSALGMGVIKLEEGQTVDRTVILRKTN
ncbi:MAG: hypothetical protein KF900_05395 [Bacteroidetes bacterium]|nr:hypothetical protein [Bacteroidota bacterium]